MKDLTLPAVSVRDSFAVISSVPQATVAWAYVFHHNLVIGACHSLTFFQNHLIRSFDILSYVFHIGCNGRTEGRLFHGTGPCRLVIVCFNFCLLQAILSLYGSAGEETLRG